MDRQSSIRNQGSKDSTLLSVTDLFQRPTINRKDCGLSIIDKSSHRNTESYFAHDLSKIPVTLNAIHTVQPKLKIGQPNDRYEQEADRMAERVMRMSEPELSSSVGDSAQTNSTIPRHGTIQRVCAPCSEEYKMAENENRPVEPANLCSKYRTREEGLIQTR